MNAYKIIGTSRQIGAIGIHEKYERIIPAENAREAYLKNHEQMTAKGREFIHVTEIQESKIALICGLGMIGTSFHTIEPERYLYTAA